MASSSRLFSSIARVGGISRLAARSFHTTTRNLAVKDIKTTAEFHELVSTTPKPVLVDCFAEWCGPCKAISPILEKLSDQAAFSETVDFVKFDVDALPDLAQELGIRAMPTFILYKDGEKVNELVGANPPALLKLIEGYAK
ncbi:thioredoxin-like protein [Thelonectria olida]|uniref:Thioredoxin-like protein n=1 Tax=Thelonectria olida TaxID=1576542 RepID=A0A9P8WD59_9HYPO|nr:thioredoxin-like protein [Thelonectria olida]